MPRDLFTEVKQAYDIVEVARQTVPDLKQKGSYRWEGKCPFHQDDNPSLSIYTREQRFHCYGCGAKGDVIEWWQLTHNLSKPYDAVLAMADEKGIDPPKRKTKGASAQERVFGAIANIVDYWHSQLPDEVRAHLRDHYGLTDETINFWTIGYSGGDMLAHLKDQGIAIKDAKETGLVTAGKRAKPYILLSKRIIFPFLRWGMPVYTTGRQVEGMGALDSETDRKYLNQYVQSTDKPYISTHVRKPLWGGDDIAGARNVLITEGVTDALLLWQNREDVGPGWAIVGLAGKELTEGQADFVATAAEAKPVYICLDTDEEGLKGAIACGLKLFTRGTDVRIVRLSQDETDLNQYLQDVGVDGFLSDVEKSQPFHLYWLHKGMFESDKDVFWHRAYLPVIARKGDLWIDANGGVIAAAWGIDERQLKKDLVAAAKASPDERVRGMDDLLKQFYTPIAVKRSENDSEVTMWSKSRKQIVGLSLTRTRSLLGMIAPDVDLFSAARDSGFQVKSRAALQQLVEETMFTWAATLPSATKYKQLRNGLHVVGDQLVIVSGDHAMIKEEGGQWRAVDDPFVGKQAFINCSLNTADWCPWGVDELNAPLVYDRKVVYDMLSLAIDEAWEWKHDNDCYILAGTAMAFTWASAFPRKPLVHILGKSGSGKSALIVGLFAGSDYYIGSGGPLILNSSYEQSVTMSGVMGKYSSSAMTLILDEAEPKDSATKYRMNEKLLDVLKILRNAAEYKGKILRGTPDGGYREEELSIGCCCGSISIWEAEAEDRRWLIIEPQELPDKAAPITTLRQFWQGTDLDEVRRTILLAFQDDFGVLRKQHSTMLHGGLPNENLVGPSQRDNALPILATIQMLSSDTDDIIQRFFSDKHEYYLRRLGSSTEVRLMDLLLNAPFDASSTDQKNILSQYNTGVFSPSWTAPHGVALNMEGDELYLYINFALAQRDGPLRNTEFQSESTKGLANALSNHPAFVSASKIRKFGDVRVRWVVIDMNKCMIQMVQQESEGKIDEQTGLE